VSTLLCAIAPGYGLLLAARTAAGAFGGVVSVGLMAIVGDVFADFRRGTAMGVVMSAFAVASIVGVPAGLFVANHFGLGSPFGFLSGLSLLVWFLAASLLPSLRGHLAETHPPILASFLAILREPNHQRAFAYMTALVLSTFTIVPYIGAYVVANTGRTEAELP